MTTFKNIPFVQEFKPTKEEFENFIDYVESIEDQMQTGIVKVLFY